MEVFVGLDWGEQHHQVHALDTDGRTRLTLRVSHDRAGLEQLRAELAALGEPAAVGIAIERREGLLVEHLLAWGHPVYPVNPRVAARAREGYRSAPVQSDALDAFALSDLLRRQVTAWRTLRQPSPTLAGLQARAKDPNIRQALIDRYSGKEHAIGTKHLPGPLHAIVRDVWAALALGVAWLERGARMDASPSRTAPHGGPVAPMGEDTP